jgi:uncharacterized protein (DUF1684 family)
MPELEKFRQEKDEFFKASPHSPLEPTQKKSFKGLNYFPDNPALRLEVTIEEFPDKKTVGMQTSTGEVQMYQRYGKFKFTVEGQEAELTVYSNEHGFFLPFVDALAGRETYGAGRYVEPEPLAAGKLLVDFNQAYNPYCAYNANWSCPLPPRENRLQVPIRAGEKIYE